jgi:HAMP domain-containing protein
MSIRVRFIIVIGVLSLVASVVLAYASYQFSLKNAKADARTQGAIVFKMIDSVRGNFLKSQRPLIADLVGEDRFYPEIMSGFSISRGVWEMFQKSFPTYKFKPATLNPLYPPDLADDDEKNLIAAFEADKSIKNTEGLLEKGGRQYYYFAKPVVVKGKCLRCHNTPEDAPKDIVAIYGPANGFNWKKGQVIATAIVYIPMDEAVAAAKKTATSLFALGATGIVLLMGVIWFFLSSGVVTPLAKLQKKTTQISLGKELDEGIGVSSNDEIGDLAKAIDRLRISTAKLLERCAGK